MSISATRARLEEGLLDFLWNEWSQLGVLGRVERPTAWVQDLEALLVMSFEAARADSRLFDEILDWLVTNEQLLSVRRLRTLARRSPDPTLVAAVLAWLARHRPQSRFAGGSDDAPAPAEQRRLFFEKGFPIRRADETFALHGWERPAVSPSGKSSAPDLRAPIALGLRLRRLLGPGVRAEVARILLTASAPRMTVAAITASAAFGRRNVQEALTELEDAGVVSAVRRGNQRWYATDRQGWAGLLGVAEGELPVAVDWVALLGAVTRILVGLRASVEGEEYLRASAARALLEDVRADLEWAGIAASVGRASEAPDELEAVVERVLAALGVAS